MIKWTRRDDDRWVAAQGKYRLEIRPPHKNGPLTYYWSIVTVTKPDSNGWRGGASSLAASKEEAEQQLRRFKIWSSN